MVECVHCAFVNAVHKMPLFIGSNLFDGVCFHVFVALIGQRIPKAVIIFGFAGMDLLVLFSIFDIPILAKLSSFRVRFHLLIHL